MSQFTKIPLQHSNIFQNDNIIKIIENGHKCCKCNSKVEYGFIKNLHEDFIRVSAVKCLSCDFHVYGTSIIYQPPIERIIKYV